jgi:hypothetical protein
MLYSPKKPTGTSITDRMSLIVLSCDNRLCEKAGLVFHSTKIQYDFTLEFYFNVKWNLDHSTEEGSTNSSKHAREAFMSHSQVEM